MKKIIMALFFGGIFLTSLHAMESANSMDPKQEWVNSLKQQCSEVITLAIICPPQELVFYIVCFCVKRLEILKDSELEVDFKRKVLLLLIARLVGWTNIPTYCSSSSPRLLQYLPLFALQDLYTYVNVDFENVIELDANLREIPLNSEILAEIIPCLNMFIKCGRADLEGDERTFLTAFFLNYLKGASDRNGLKLMIMASLFQAQDNVFPSLTRCQSATILGALTTVGCILVGVLSCWISTSY